DGTDVTYYHYDAIGNVVETTDDNGAPVASFVQDAFGNVLGGTASGYHLTTKEYFPDFGLYYFNARWYDPFTGRFISKTVVTPVAEHPYVYCEGNPVNDVDPSGLLPGLPGGIGNPCGTVTVSFAGTTVTGIVKTDVGTFPGGCFWYTPAKITNRVMAKLGTITVPTLCPPGMKCCCMKPLGPKTVGPTARPTTFFGDRTGDKTPPAKAACMVTMTINLVVTISGTIGICLPQLK
ncbi:RHS repeat domain-containing protein, partial [Candidatus Sumerlaeota bacterium]